VESVAGAPCLIFASCSARVLLDDPLSLVRESGVAPEPLARRAWGLDTRAVRESYAARSAAHWSKNQAGMGVSSDQVMLMGRLPVWAW